MTSLRPPPPNVLVENVNVNSNSSENFNTVFDVKCEIGRGRFAKVCKVVKKNNQSAIAAAKIIRRFRNGMDTYSAILQEIEILQKSKGHPFIVDIIDYYVTNRDVSVILEYSSGGDLYRHVFDQSAPLSEADTRVVMTQLLQALKFIHAQSIVHLDIKPENILIKSTDPCYKISLCDFGVAKYLDKNTIIRNLVGTPDYAAPEILNFNPIHLTTDIWSTGVVAYFLLTSVSPFWSETKEKTYSNVTSLRIIYDDELFEGITESALDFIKRSIVLHPDSRPSSSDLLHDPWIKNCNINERSDLPTPCVSQSPSSTSIASTKTDLPERIIHVS
ncbi:Serine threonine kinase [Cichlidogyrus casuarinus]|uniref:Serine threonine kinase n=1 Tax=Cichlidogyrus casuarinus TaxID=1844966 RepID=A0ABD2Q1B4_9PLAT